MAYVSQTPACRPSRGSDAASGGISLQELQTGLQDPYRALLRMAQVLMPTSAYMALYMALYVALEPGSWPRSTARRFWADSA